MMADNKMSAKPVSSIPGQSLGDYHTSINSQLLCVSIFSMTASFLVSLIWGNFVTSSVEAVQVKTNRKIPTPVANLIAAVCVTVTSVLILSALHSWEQKVLKKSAAPRFAR